MQGRQPTDPPTNRPTVHPSTSPTNHLDVDLANRLEPSFEGTSPSCPGYNHGNLLKSVEQPRRSPTQANPPSNQATKKPSNQASKHPPTPPTPPRIVPESWTNDATPKALATSTHPPPYATRHPAACNAEARASCGQLLANFGEPRSTARRPPAPSARTTASKSSSRASPRARKMNLPRSP